MRSDPLPPPEGAPPSSSEPAPQPDVSPAPAAWRVLAPAPPWRRGVLEAGGGRTLGFEVIDEREGVAELALHPDGLDAEDILALLARIGLAALGDTRRGGLAVAGPPRLARGDAPRPARWWPERPVFAGERPLPVLAVSAATRRALAKGHPWVLRDRETGDTSLLRPGALVALRAHGAHGGLARVEGPGPLAARLWAAAARDPRDAPSVEERVARALARRRPLLEGARRSPDGTDAFRLVHGEADGLPGLHVDRLGPLLRVLLTGRACEPVLDRVLDAIVRALASELGPDPPVVRVTHLRDRPAGRLECVRLARGRIGDGLPGQQWRDGRLLVRERGLRFAVDPGLGEPTRPRPGTGLFLDQRENRARLAELARDPARRGTWINLFAHTGAFSAALLAAGADEVVSVDLSAPYLAWLEANLTHSGLDPGRHRSVRGDGRRHLERLAPGVRLAGVVIDPPTAAAAGRRFWSVRRDLEPLLEAALARLAPGGVLLVSRHDRGGGRGFNAAIQSAASRARVALARVQDAPPGIDFPRMPGFPEGDAFHADIAVRDVAR